MSKEKKTIDLLKQIAHLTTLPKKSSLLQWEFQEVPFGIYGFETIFKGKVYSCFFDPAEGYSLSIYKEGEGIPGINGVEALIINGFCYKSYFEKLFNKASRQCRKEILEFQKKNKVIDAKNRQSCEESHQKYSGKLSEAIKHLTEKP